MLKSTLESLFGLDEISQSRVIVFQDGNETSIPQVVDMFRKNGSDIELVQRIPQLPNPKDAAARISLHYKYTLTTVCGMAKPDFAIIIEDDMIFTPDFLS